MSEDKNLRGNKDKLLYYRLKDAEKYEERQMLIKVHKEPKTYWYPVKDRILFSENEVRKFSLDKYGEHIPYIDGELTIFNNYFFDFWSYYLTAEGTALYAHLKRYAYGDKDYCYPNLDLIAAKMDKHRKTLLNYIDLLEHYGFIYQFGVVNQSRNNLEESSLYKIRKQTPLLSKKLIYGDPNIIIPEDAPPHIQKALKKEQKGLPEKLRKEHDKFIEKYMNNAKDLEEAIDYEKIYLKWEQYGRLLQKRTTKKVISKEDAYIVQEMNKEEKLILTMLLEQIQKKISKPSFDTWFRDITLKVDQETLVIYTPNKFSKEWLQNSYSELINECLSRIEIHDFEEVLYREYEQK
ncbi:MULTISPECIES: DnaA N-terminal domain-containing protein [Bacillati]|uniref:DnaA N-terminal domain-containing protein n=1 Tax=Bacillati TaxID=1783272 RepID=UPI0022B9BFC1|nr:DnaA N-terminal domain-containing protein [Caldifermentibacillus hisashii]